MYNLAAKGSENVFRGLEASGVMLKVHDKYCNSIGVEIVRKGQKMIDCK